MKTGSINGTVNIKSILYVMLLSILPKGISELADNTIDFG